MRHPVQTTCCLLMLSLAMAGTSVQAAGARTGVHRDHGEMVLLRTVSARPAVRPSPPGIALIVDPTPNRQLLPTLASGELSDADFMALDTGQQVQPGVRAPGGLASPMVRTLAGPAGIGANAREASGVQASGNLGAAGGPLGAVGNATRGIGGHITGALSQLPFGQPANGRGP